uniref:Uncharacterized protein n=1 Tax=Triticum urartu TaxID=4572 RepID=A0A8R7TQE0_TRIUA
MVAITFAVSAPCAHLVLLVMSPYSMYLGCGICHRSYIRTVIDPFCSGESFEVLML